MGPRGLNFHATVPAAHVLSYAMISAIIRESAKMELTDLLGGLYMASRKSLAAYWNLTKGFERLAGDEPVIKELKSAFKKGRRLSPAHEEQFDLRMHFVELSSQVDEVFTAAGEIAAASKSAQPGPKPLVAPEDLLLALARYPRSDIGKRLVELGLSLEKLKIGVDQIERRIM